MLRTTSISTRHQYHQYDTDILSMYEMPSKILLTTLMRWYIFIRIRFCVNRPVPIYWNNTTTTAVRLHPIHALRARVVIVYVLLPVRAHTIRGTCFYLCSSSYDPHVRRWTPAPIVQIELRILTWLFCYHTQRGEVPMCVYTWHIAVNYPPDGAHMQITRLPPGKTMT